jgi:general stress protein YciG
MALWNGMGTLWGHLILRTGIANGLGLPEHAELRLALRGARSASCKHWLTSGEHQELRMCVAARNRGSTMPKIPSRRGFAAMSPDQRRFIASKGGRSVPADRRSFSQDRQLAARAGAKGGQSGPQPVSRSQDDTDPCGELQSR